MLRLTGANIDNVNDADIDTNLCSDEDSSNNEIDLKLLSLFLSPRTDNNWTHVIKGCVSRRVKPITYTPHEGDRQEIDAMNTLEEDKIPKNKMTSATIM